MDCALLGLFFLAFEFPSSISVASFDRSPLYVDATKSVLYVQNAVLTRDSLSLASGAWGSQMSLGPIAPFFTSCPSVPVLLPPGSSLSDFPCTRLRSCSTRGGMASVTRAVQKTLRFSILSCRPSFFFFHVTNPQVATVCPAGSFTWRRILFRRQMVASLSPFSVQSPPGLPAPPSLRQNKKKKAARSEPSSLRLSAD